MRAIWRVVLLAGGFVTMASAGLWQRGADVRDLNDDGPWLAHGWEPVRVAAVVTQEVSTITTNPFAAGESYLQTLWGAVGGSVTNSFEYNSLILKSALATAKANNNDALANDLRDLALEILSLYTKLKAEGCQFTGIAFTTNTTLVITNVYEARD